MDTIDEIIAYWSPPRREPPPEPGGPSWAMPHTMGDFRLVQSAPDRAPGQGDIEQLPPAQPGPRLPAAPVEAVQSRELPPLYKYGPMDYVMGPPAQGTNPGSYEAYNQAYEMQHELGNRLNPFNNFQNTPYNGPPLDERGFSVRDIPTIEHFEAQRAQEAKMRRQKEALEAALGLAGDSVKRQAGAVQNFAGQALGKAREVGGSIQGWARARAEERRAEEQQRRMMQEREEQDRREFEEWKARRAAGEFGGPA